MLLLLLLLLLLLIFNDFVVGIGQTPLMRAAMKGHSKVVQWLLLSGADPLPLDAQGVSAREQAAAAGGAADIVAMLQEAERYAGRVEL